MNNLSHTPKFLGVIALFLSALILTGCSEASEEPKPEPKPAQSVVRELSEFETKVQAYYDSRPDFFSFKTLDDVPDDLNWENGDGKRIFASAEAKQGGTLRTFISSMPPTIRPLGPDANNSFRGELYDDNGLGLIEMHPDDFTPIPSLATEWAVTDNNQTVFYRLDPDARFSDGMPVTADDFLFTFYFMHSRDIQAPWYNDYYNVEFKNITKYDDYTISITLAEPKPDPVYSTAIGPRPMHFYTELGEDYPTRYQWKFEPTTGPYELKDENIRKGRSITLTKVENWWAQDKKYMKGRYNVAAKEYQIIRETDKVFELFLRGDIDMFGLSLPKYWYDRANAEAFQKGYIRRVTFYNQYPRPPYGLYLNTAHPLLSDQNIRKGLHHATNFERVIEFHFRGDYARLNTMSDGYGEYSNPKVKARKFDIEKAREYFEKAGFTKRGPDGILVNDRGQRLSFKITMSDSPLKEILPILREEARKAGVEYNIEVLEGTESYKRVMEKRHDIAFTAWGTGLPTPRFWEFFHSENANKPQTNNITNTADAEMDPLIIKYRRSSSKDEKRELALKLTEMVHEEASFIPGFYRPWLRVGHWQWVKFPEGFLPKLSESADAYGLFWIDEEEKEKVLEARSSGKPYADPEPVIYDQYREE